MTVIGLGLMGRALAAAFLRNGHPTTVWNRTAAKAEQLVAQGAVLADAVILHSGPRSAFDQHEQTLRTLGAGTTYLGEDPGLSSLHDVAALGLMWSILNGFLQGAALLGAAGVDATTFAPLAIQSAGTVADWLSGYAQQVDDGVYPADDSTIDTHLAAMAHLVDDSETLGVNAELPRLIKALTDRALAEQFRKPAGVRP